MNGNTKKNLYEVTIADVPLKLLSEHSEKLVQEMVELVDANVSKALENQKTPSIQNAALLAALNIAEDYILLKNTAKQRLDRLSDHAESVLASLDSPDDEKELNV
tara:strand:- start:2729 stop:3043 length:315 start_codon:yes stop_codon:yes gene_type:complete